MSKQSKPEELLELIKKKAFGNGSHGIFKDGQVLMVPGERGNYQIDGSTKIKLATDIKALNDDELKEFIGLFYLNVKKLKLPDDNAIWSTIGIPDFYTDKDHIEIFHLTEVSGSSSYFPLIKLFYGDQEIQYKIRKGEKLWINDVIAETSKAEGLKDKLASAMKYFYDRLLGSVKFSKLGINC